MAVAAVKPFLYAGKHVKAGQVLDPEPDPTLAKRLVDGRFAQYTDQARPGERPPGTGRGTRRPAKTA